MARQRNNGACAASPTLALAILVLFAFCARSASAVGSTPHSAFSYKDSDPDGPAKWATLQEDWATCDSGTEQSPIDIAEVEVSKDLGPLEHTYRARPAVVQNRGHDFMLNWTEGNGKLTVGGKEYALLQAHWHAPSEHTVNGTRKLLGDLRPYFEKLTGKQNGTEEVKDPVDPATWIDKASGYFRYEGSLTTPPCTEGVIWTIMSKVEDASKEQIESLKSETKVTS
nr:unnamed protein product [Digitaria exilis]